MQYYTVYMKPTLTEGTRESKKIVAMNIAATILFAAISIWWLFVQPLNENAFVHGKHAWSSAYWLIAILGGIFGITISHYWQGHKSVFGRAILAISIGLFLQAFGQIIYNYYTLFTRVEVPYPSIGDIGYFGSVIAYIYGALLLTKACGLNFTIQSFKNRMLAMVLPLAMLVLSYLIFLQGYQNHHSPITTFLDFGYPLGQAVYVSVTLLVVYLSHNYMDGILKRPIVLLLVALFVQYVCDFDFLYQANHDLWYAGSIGDYLYAVSYFLMTMALINLGHIRLKLNKLNL